MEDCWEADVGARLTVQCVYERMKQLIYEPPDDMYEEQFLEKLKSPMKTFPKYDSISGDVCVPLIRNSWDTCEKVPSSSSSLTSSPGVNVV